MSGQLQRGFWSVLDLVLGKVREHIVEPIQELSTNLFNTLQRRDPIVTHDELVQSHLALSRMLESYERNISDRDGPSGPMGELVNKVSSTIYSPKPASASTAPNKLPAVPLDPGSSKNRLSTSRQVSSMERLMRAYEKELQAPIKGLLFGDLIQSVLIQVEG